MTQAYVLPKSTQGFPRQLSLNQFLQTILVGISGIRGELVRPKWQSDPPKNPDIDVNWIGYGVTKSTPDANSFIGVNPDQSVYSQRHETLEIECHIYGPSGLDIYGLLRDGFQIDQNRYAFTLANMGFVEISDGRSVPDLINERWVNRVITSIYMRREVQRLYPVLTLISASGTIFAPLSVDENDYSLNWLVPADE